MLDAQRTFDINLDPVQSGEATLQVSLVDGNLHFSMDPVPPPPPARVPTVPRIRYDDVRDMLFNQGLFGFSPDGYGSHDAEQDVAGKMDWKKYGKKGVKPLTDVSGSLFSHCNGWLQITRGVGGTTALDGVYVELERPQMWFLEWSGTTASWNPVVPAARGPLGGGYWATWDFANNRSDYHLTQRFTAGDVTDFESGYDEDGDYRAGHRIPVAPLTNPDGSRNDETTLVHAWWDKEFYPRKAFPQMPDGTASKVAWISRARLVGPEDYDLRRTNLFMGIGMDMFTSAKQGSVGSTPSGQAKNPALVGPCHRYLVDPKAAEPVYGRTDWHAVGLVAPIDTPAELRALHSAYPFPFVTR